MSNRRQKRMDRKLTTVKPSDDPAVAQEKRKVKKEIQKVKKAKCTLQKYASLYVRRKDELLPLMQEASGKEFSADATHGELVSLYVRLIRTDPQFAGKVQAMVDRGDFNNTEGGSDPVTAIANALGGLFGIAGGIVDNINLKDEQDAYFERMILDEQRKSQTTKILLVTGISLIAVGGLIYVVMKK